MIGLPLLDARNVTLFELNNSLFQLKKLRNLILAIRNSNLETFFQSEALITNRKLQKLNIESNNVSPQTLAKIFEVKNNVQKVILFFLVKSASNKNNHLEFSKEMFKYIPSGFKPKF